MTHNAKKLLQKKNWKTDLDRGQTDHVTTTLARLMTLTFNATQIQELKLIIIFLY